MNKILIFVFSYRTHQYYELNPFEYNNKKNNTIKFISYFVYFI